MNSVIPSVAKRSRGTPMDKLKGINTGSLELARDDRLV